MLVVVCREIVFIFEIIRYFLVSGRSNKTFQVSSFGVIEKSRLCIYELYVLDGILGSS